MRAKVATRIHNLHYIANIVHVLAVKPATGLICYGVLSTAFWRKRSDASVSTNALLMSAMLTTKSWQLK